MVGKYKVMLPELHTMATLLTESAAGMKHYIGKLRLISASSVEYPDLCVQIGRNTNPDYIWN